MVWIHVLYVEKNDISQVRETNFILNAFFVWVYTKTRKDNFHKLLGKGHRYHEIKVRIFY